MFDEMISLFEFLNRSSENYFQMKSFLLFYLTLAFPFLAFSQTFTMKCHIRDKYIPSLYFTTHDNVYADLLANRVPFKKENDSVCVLNLAPRKISFAQIGGDAVLVIPGENPEGLFERTHFEPFDTGSANFKLMRISAGITKTIVDYSIGSSFNRFLSVASRLRKCIDSITYRLVHDPHSWKDSQITLALKEYLAEKLAHFLVLPVLFGNPYNRDQLAAIIRRDVHINYPEYWLQVQSGRIFLKNYYRKILLPEAGYDLMKSQNNKIFSYEPFKKLVTYQYFLECLELGTVKTRFELTLDWEEAEAGMVLSNGEKKTMQDVYVNIQQVGQDISEMFTALPLINTDGRLLTDKEKKALVSGSDILIDFWASWCVPCRQAMERHRAENVVISHREYRIIYLSIDENDKLWKAVKYPFLHSKNSFRITGPDNSFIREFGIYTIPRYILIMKGGIVSRDFGFK